MVYDNAICDAIKDTKARIENMRQARFEEVAKDIYKNETLPKITELQNNYQSKVSEIKTKVDAEIAKIQKDNEDRARKQVNFEFDSILMKLDDAMPKIAEDK